MVERFGVLKLIIEDDEGRKTVVPFVRDEITIGRQEGNTIRLTERNVSRRHARLMRNNGHVLIEDLGSYNGIRINGDRISGQVQVADGDLIQIGDYDLALQAEDAAGLPTMPLETSGLGATRKLPDPSATMPALPSVEQTQEASDDDVREADDDGEVGKDTPPSLPKHQATAVIRIDQVDAGRKRSVQELDASEAPRLVVLNTDLAGREFSCTRTELKIGRTDDNDIAIDHRSLSRTHCKVVREESGEWRVIDMQSANGLMVNGEPYAQVTLRAGDVIELGHVKLKFVGAGEQVNIAPSTSSSVTTESDQPGISKAPLIAMAIAVLVLLVGGGGYMLMKSGEATQPRKTNPKDPTAAGTPAQDDPAAADAEKAEALKAALAKVEEAKAAALTLDFNQAEVLAKDATVDGELTSEAEAFLRQLDGERANRNALEAAGKALDAGGLEKAKVQLDSAKGTKLLRPRYDELEARRSQAVADKLAANTPPPQPVVKNEQPPQPVVKKDPPPQKTETPEAPPPTQKNPEAEALYKQGNDERKVGNYESALLQLERCVKIAPTYAPCYRALASAYASIGARDQSLNEQQKARKNYERYLELVPPNDPYAPRVREILDAKQ